MRKQQKPKQQPKLREPLLFIDTNILLDFYRARNDAGISLLTRLDTLHPRIITTCQVEMEFKKNRQKAITESVTALKPPDFKLTTPAFLSEAASVKVVKARMHDVQKRISKLRARILAALENPTTHDRIYRTTQRLFSSSTPLNLKRDHPDYASVWRKAFRRFLEGKPPRKKDDTSVGDSLNWEWIVCCVERTNRDVIIVSRDADYGLVLDDKGYANNWLIEEIKSRVNQQRKLALVDRLSSALKLIDVKVTKEEISSERTIVSPKPWRATDDFVDHLKSLARKEAESEIEQAVGQAIEDLVDHDDISSQIAGTNASGWTCDAYRVEEILFKNGECLANIFFSLTGKQNDDQPWCGDSISGECVLSIDKGRHVTVKTVRADVQD